jgi:hypothetical protein
MTFADEEAYLDFFRAHPALRKGWSPAVAAYVLRDLVGTRPAMRSSCAIDAVRADATDTLIDRATVDAVQRLACPARLMWAQRGLQNEDQGLYDQSRLAAAGLDPARIAVEHVPDVNHYSILFDAHAAALVADRVVEVSS